MVYELPARGERDWDEKLNASIEAVKATADAAAEEQATGRLSEDALNAAYGGQENVTAYGAAGDGITDDTAAIQAALDAATGGVVFFPPGTYLVSSTLTVPNQVSLRGCGGGVRGSTHLSSIAAQTTIEYTGSDTACLNFAGDAHHVDDIHVTCSASTPTAGSVGLYFASGWGVHMHRTSVSAFYDCVQFKNGKEWTMSDCLIFGPKNHGLLIQNANNPDGGDMGVIGCQFISGTANAAVRWESGGGLRFVGNKINGDGSGGYFSYGVDMRVADGVNTGVMLFSDNSIENFTTCGIYGAQLGSTGIVAKVTLVGNEIASFRGAKGVDIGPGFASVVVEGNAFDANTTSITMRGVNGVAIGPNLHTGSSAVVAISGQTKWTMARQTIFTDNVTLLSNGSPASAGTWADAAVDTAREIPTIESLVDYTTIYSIVWPAYHGGLIDFAFSGVVGGLGAVAIKGTRSVSMGGSGAPTVTTVGTDGGLNLTRVDLVFTPLATGLVKVEMKLPSDTTGYSLNGAFSLRVIGPVSSIKKGV